MANLKTLLITFLCATLVIIGCSSGPQISPHYEVYVKPGIFNAAQEQQIQQALASWQEWTGGVFTYNLHMDVDRYVYSDPNQIVYDRYTLTDADIVLGITGRAFRDPVLNSTMSVVALDNPDAIANFEQVVLHETGHAFGLEHYAGTGKAVMTENIFSSTASPTITCEDAKAFCAIWSCTPPCVNDAGTDASNE